jgi:hypothetical protein
LTNAELFQELYSTNTPVQMSEMVQQAIQENVRFTMQAQKLTKSRSRNPKQALQAGQSVQTLSFVDTKATS